LLDECIQRRLKFSLSTSNHRCETAPEAGFAGKTNGELLRLAGQNFDIFITLDKGFPYQQNLEGQRISTILVHAKSSNLAHLLPHVSSILETLTTIQPGQIIQIG
jgi:hypothetical protein